ncbi:hypothetical protein [Microbacterium suaedae]|uniref:hypothetical protein n=1 Tax=Microbacterium suaedae TaxID=2067813 RepID=UPI0013A68114|nr:hypothetical protein [Microbacterium suaedae]
MTRSPTVAGVLASRSFDFGGQQRERFKGRDVVEWCVNGFKQWRRIALCLNTTPPETSGP